MPFSDSLYSAEDSDADSFSDELAPANGYLNPDRGALAMPPGPMVQDPSIDVDDDKRPEAKVLIPSPNTQAPLRAGSVASNHPAITQSSSSRTDALYPSSESRFSPPPRHTHTPQYRRSEHHHHAVFSEHIPFMGGPPPAYTPSPTTSSSATQAAGSERRYPSLTENHLEQGFLRPHSPESMGGPLDDDDPDERTPLADNVPKSPRRVVAKRVLLLGVLSLVVSLVVTLSCVMLLRRRNSMANLRPQHGMPANDTRSYCPLTTFKNDQAVYEFPVGSDLSILQTSHNNGGPSYMAHVEAKGEIRLGRLPKDSEHGNQAHITVDVRVSDPKIKVIKTWDEHTRSLKVSTPVYVQLEKSKHHCVSLEITAWFPEDAELTNLLVQSRGLNFRILDDIKVKVSGRSKFTSEMGSVFFPTLGGLDPSEKVISGTGSAKILESTRAPSQSLLSPRSVLRATHPFSSRQIIVETAAGIIRGHYPLLDYLSLSTGSGNVEVDVLPQEALASAPAPADLEVHTANGEILVNLPLADGNYAPPSRDYITNVHSTSGSINGVFYLGSLASFKSTVGKLGFKALPIIQASASENPRETSRFETHTVSGVTDIKVLDPLCVSHKDSAEDEPLPKHQPSPDPDSPIGGEESYVNLPPNVNQSTPMSDPSKQNKSKALRNLQSKHSSNSGMVTVVYPKIWEGSVHATAVSGDITVRGSGLKTVREREGWAYREFLARKGVKNKGEGCTVEMSDISGDLRFFLE